MDKLQQIGVERQLANLMIMRSDVEDATGIAVLKTINYLLTVHDAEMKYREVSKLRPEYQAFVIAGDSTVAVESVFPNNISDATGILNTIK